MIYTTSVVQVLCRLVSTEHFRFCGFFFSFSTPRKRRCLHRTQPHKHGNESFKWHSHLRFPQWQLNHSLVYSIMFMNIIARSLNSKSRFLWFRFQIFFSFFSFILLKATSMFVSCSNQVRFSIFERVRACPVETSVNIARN